MTSKWDCLRKRWRNLKNQPNSNYKQSQKGKLNGNIKIPMDSNVMDRMKANFDLANRTVLECGQMMKAIGKSKDNGEMGNFMGKPYNNHKMEMKLCTRKKVENLMESLYGIPLMGLERKKNGRTDVIMGGWEYIQRMEISVRNQHICLGERKRIDSLNLWPFDYFHKHY